MTAQWAGCRITTLGQAAPLAFAVDELTRSLAALSPPRAGALPAATPELRLGTFADFGAVAEWPTVAQPDLDDAIYIAVTALDGIIAGSNPRSVLLAAYRYLTELGYRWVRPGQDGEYLPPVASLGGTVWVAEVAAYRHRGVCIEGAVSYEHVRDLIDWLPKVGCNCYFMQFREAFTFFERWYAHRENPLLPAENFTIEQARAFKVRLSGELVRRGLIFHDVGHGWTCDPLGLPGLGWEYAPPEVPPAVVPFLAEVDGRRELWRGVPINTQLCYSNAVVRRLVVDDIAAYVSAHPEVDLLHVWLADGTNNHCECADCRALRPADWYVRLLNEIDKRLTTLNLPTRIVFLIYVDLLWPPAVERLHNQERFVLMFAPITRTYSAAFAVTAAPSQDALPPYKRNQLEFPRDVHENVAFLRAWQELFPGDSFDYDYHLMWDHYKDPGGVATAEVLHADIRGLAALGLNGLVSCQVQRAFSPTGLAMAVLGRTLWDRDLALRDIAEDYFLAAFGTDGRDCLTYCEGLSRLFDPPYLRGEKPPHDLAAAAAYARIPATIAAFRPTIRRNLEASNRCHARSWHYLDRHADICLLLAEALRQRALGADAAAHEAWLATRQFVREQEHDLHPVLDVYEFLHVLGRLFPTPK